MLVKRFLFIVMFFMLTSFVGLHKYYISLTQIDYINESKSVQITMNVFLDDFEETLEKSFSQKFNLNSKLEPKNTNELIQKYLKDHFAITINNNLQEIHYLGKEYEGDIVYFYIEIGNIQDISTIEVKNTMLTDYFPEQQNLIKLKINGKFDSLLLTEKSDKGLLKF